MIALDLCAGTGSATIALADRGWEVITVDNDPQHSPEILADVKDWRWNGAQPNFIWASPPCVEFSRESMPWSRTGNIPDISIVRACYRIIKDCRPRYWIIENVRGAVPWVAPMLGKAHQIINPYFLWGVFPDLGKPKLTKRNKESLSSKKTIERAMIPYALSLAVADAIEMQPQLF